jgi:hypothetical protein
MSVTISVIIIVSLALASIGAGLIAYNWNRHRQKERTKISFKEGLDLTELPIVTFYHKDKKLHFLLDTGSNISYINTEVLKEIDAHDLGTASSTFGVEGSGIETHHYNIEISYKDNKFSEEFGAVDLSGAFKAIEMESGIRLHGIIGNRFFEKYKYVIDFRELTAYR